MNKRLSNIIGIGNCVIDLGCGSGHLLSELSGRFERRIGIDVSRRRLEQMANGQTEGWNFRIADLNKAFPLDDEAADVLVANQVIEHIIDPVGFAGDCYRVLRPSGRCVITTPNIRYLKNIAHILFSGYGPRTAGGNTIDGAWDDGHIHYFTHQDLRELFSHVGFRKVKSSALIDLTNSSRVRRMMDSHARNCLIREYMSGNILLWAEK